MLKHLKTIIISIFLVFISINSIAAKSGVLRVCRQGERAATCFWADNFKSQDLVESNNGVISGSPVFTGTGIDLDGSSDYINYSIDSNNLAEFAIVLVFTPDFTANETTARRTFFSNLTGTTRLQRYETTTYNDTLRLYINGTLVINGTGNVNNYATLWKTGEINYLVVNAKSGDTDIWLNGNLVQQGDPTAFDSDAISTLTVGAYGSSYLFDGEYHSIKFFNKKLDDVTAEAYSTSYINWGYENETIINYLTDDTHMVSGQLTDFSGNYNAPIYGTVNKLTDQWGYYFSGTNDYAQTTSIPLSSTEFTFSVWINSENPYTSQIPISLESATTTAFILQTRIGTGLTMYVGGVGLANAATQFSLDSTAGENRWYHAIASYDGVNTKLFVDGSRCPDAVTPIPPVLNDSQVLTLGARFGLGQDYKGKIARFKFWDKALNEAQIYDLYLREVNSLNRIQ